MTTLFTIAMNVSMVFCGIGTQENVCDLHLDTNNKAPLVQMLGNTIDTDNNVIHYGVDVDERTLEKYSNLV